MLFLWFSCGFPGQAGNVWAVRSIARLDGRNSSALPPLGDLTVTREWVAMQLSQITELLQVSEPNIYSVYIFFMIYIIYYIIIYIYIIYTYYIHIIYYILYLYIINMYINNFVDLFVTPHSTPFDPWPEKTPYAAFTWLLGLSSGAKDHTLW